MFLKRIPVIDLQGNEDAYVDKEHLTNRLEDVIAKPVVSKHFPSYSSE